MESMKAIAGNEEGGSKVMSNMMIVLETNIAKVITVRSSRGDLEMIIWERPSEPLSLIIVKWGVTRK
jgi:hypothetical protein